MSRPAPGLPAPNIRWAVAAACLVGLLAPAAGRSAQNTNIFLPVDSIEYLLAEAPFALPDSLPGTRGDEDRTQLAVLWFEDDNGVLTKWAAAPEGGDDFNNSPRYEIAAYEIQKLFLDEPEYVVPPTVARVLPLEWYRGVREDVEPTFEGAASMLVVLQYFTYGLTADDVYDPERFETDPAYARHWANANLFTHLIRHSDSNRGNLLVSTRAANPRVFSVDNGVAFRSEDSARGTRWRTLLVDRFPVSTVARLRALTRGGLNQALGVLGQWRIVDGGLVREPPAENLWPQQGVRQEDGVVQIGLTDGEIDDIWQRIEAFLYNVDGGSFTTF